MPQGLTPASLNTKRPSSETSDNSGEASGKASSSRPLITPLSSKPLRFTSASLGLNTDYPEVVKEGQHAWSFVKQDQFRRPAAVEFHALRGSLGSKTFTVDGQARPFIFDAIGMKRGKRRKLSFANESGHFVLILNFDQNIQLQNPWCGNEKEWAGLGLNVFSFITEHTPRPASTASFDSPLTPFFDTISEKPSRDPFLAMQEEMLSTVTVPPEFWDSLLEEGKFPQHGRVIALYAGNNTATSNGFCAAWYKPGPFNDAAEVHQIMEEMQAHIVAGDVTYKNGAAPQFRFRKSGSNT